MLIAKNALPLQNFLFLIKIFEATTNIFQQSPSTVKKMSTLCLEGEDHINEAIKGLVLANTLLRKNELRKDEVAKQKFQKGLLL